MTRPRHPGVFVLGPSGIADDQATTLTLEEVRRARDLDPPPEVEVEPEVEVPDR